MSNFTILYVQDTARSAAFYQAVLGRAPVEQSAGFAMFVLEDGARLGLWAAAEVVPVAEISGGGAELCWPLASKGAVDQRFADWQAAGVEMLLEPTELDFGRSFVAADPDGHRLRVFHPSPA